MMCATDVAARGLDVKDVSVKALCMVEPIEKEGSSISSHCYDSRTQNIHYTCIHGKASQKLQMSVVVLRKYSGCQKLGICLLNYFNHENLKLLKRHEPCLGPSVCSLVTIADICSFWQVDTVCGKGSCSLFSYNPLSFPLFCERCIYLYCRPFVNAMEILSIFVSCFERTQSV